MMATSNFAAELRREAGRAVAVAHQYRLDYYRATDKQILCFFEGTDDKKYYTSIIYRSVQVEDVHCYVCDGKKNVIGTWHVLQSWQILDMERALFFVDVDHDVYLGNDQLVQTNIFTTWTYSFENYLVTSEAVQIILNQFTPLSVREKRFQEVVANFARGYDCFAQQMRPIMAWCIHMRSRGHRPNLANARMKEMFELQPNGDVKKKPGAFKRFQQDVGMQARAPIAAMKAMVARLMGQPVKQWLRGKYELWFLQEFLNRTFDRFGRSPSPRAGSRRFRKPKALEGGDLVELLAGRLTFPDELTQFLKQHSIR